MPMNNNQKAQTAAARLAKLPAVRSACTKLSLLYIDTKCRHPNLRTVCDGLESSAAALLSPVMVSLEPQISIANDIACKSLDWLETAFPVLHTPTEQIVATASSKMHEIQDVVRIAANGTVHCVQHAVTWLTADDRPLVERAVSVASVGLDSALIMSEALLDRVLPPTKKDTEEEADLLEGFEEAALRSYPVRLVSLSAKLCRRSYRTVGTKMQSVQVMENLCRSPGLVQDLQTSCLTLAWRIQGLPHYVQHQLVSLFFFLTQMYNLTCPPSQHHQPGQDGSRVSAAESQIHKDVVKVNPRATPPAWQTRGLTKTSVFDVKECVHR